MTVKGYVENLTLRSTYHWAKKAAVCLKTVWPFMRKTAYVFTSYLGPLKMSEARRNCTSWWVWKMGSRNKQSKRHQLFTYPASVLEGRSYCHAFKLITENHKCPMFSELGFNAQAQKKSLPLVNVPHCESNWFARLHYMTVFMYYSHICKGDCNTIKQNGMVV